LTRPAGQTKIDLVGFIARHDLWSDEQRRVAAEVVRRIEAEGVELVRLSFADLHGILRGKALLTAAMPSAFADGCAVTSTLLLKDTAHRTVVPVFSPGAGMGLSRLQGASDIIMVPDPTTFRVLPWLQSTGWMLCDVYFADGTPVSFSTRQLLRRMLDRLAADGLGFVTGLEVEFHITRLSDPRLALEDAGQPGTPPEVELIHQGYNHLTELRLDRIEPITDILRRQVLALGLELTSIELEFGPSQVEFVFRAAQGMRSADDMMLFRNAVKQICRRHGYHATFMCRPSFPNAMSSGWHLHQSLADGAGRNLFAPDMPGELLSPLGRHYLAGLIAGAAEAVAFSTPTINGYKRYRANSLAPDRIVWASDNRGAMLRVVGAANPSAARIENRIGEPAANPYLYLASQLATGLAGIASGAEPPPPVDAPYDVPAAMLPTSLGAALEALTEGHTLRECFGGEFIDYYATIKHAELRRYEAHVTDWEMREYFDVF
jgi:glutamine synthetase